jgi:hypothetical protein
MAAIPDLTREARALALAKARMAGKGPRYFTRGVHKQAIRDLIATAAGGGEPPA